MQRLIVSLAITFLFVPSGMAQVQQDSRCRVRFAVVQRQDTGTFKVQPDDQDLWGQWPVDANEWWAKDGNRKFPELCQTARTDAEFVVAWERRIRERAVPVMAFTFDLIEWLDRVSVTLYWVEQEPQRFVPLSSLAKESFADRGAGKAAFESALNTLQKEARKTRR